LNLINGPSTSLTNLALRWLSGVETSGVETSGVETSGVEIQNFKELIKMNNMKKLLLFLVIWISIQAISQTRLHPVTKWAFGPWYGSGCPTNGNCECGKSKNLAQEFSCQLEKLIANDIPITVYLFDGDAWSKTNSREKNACEGADCCNFVLGDDVIKKLKDNNIRALLHFWGGCHNKEQYQRAYDKIGKSLLGFYLDDGSTDTEARQAIDFMQSVMPGNSDVNLKSHSDRKPHTTFEGLKAHGNMCYVGDFGFDFEGMRAGIKRLFEVAPLLPCPYNEFTAYAYKNNETPDEETYYRRIHYGCFQAVMANNPYANTDPWGIKYSPELIPNYRYYSWLHKQLIPYFYSYAYNMHENPNQPLYRECDANSYSTKLGEEIFVAYVTDYVKKMDIKLPQGEWINYWNEKQVLKGMAKGYSVPLGKEPIFIKNGAIIPMDIERDYTGHGIKESKGMLTVVIYPNGNSTFKYRDDISNEWYEFKVSQNKDQIEISIEPKKLSIPVIYKVRRWNSAPKSVLIKDKVVKINLGGTAKESRTETACVANGLNTWMYNADKSELVVKMNP